MDCEPTTLSSSDVKMNLSNNPKKVRWAYNLEEIVYFTPILECEITEDKTTNSLLKKLKRKARALKSKRLAAFLDINNDNDFLHWLQEKTKQFMEKIPGRCGELHLEHLTDLNSRRCDEFLEFYGECKANYREITC